ncbi:MAG: response regulator transcription factor [Candidatus Omnitrophota bacterium]
MDAYKKRVLVVDDEPETVSVLKRFLSHYNYDVDGASNADQALEILKDSGADLVMLDIMMPGLKGDELAKIIRAKYQGIKIIVLTGHCKELEVLLKDGLIDGAFVKPVSLHELSNKIFLILSDCESHLRAERTKKDISAHIISIKAKLLFIEPSEMTYEFLSTYFKGMSKKGEYYLTDVAHTPHEIIEKLAMFNPDIFVVNASFFKGGNTKVFQTIFDKNLCPDECIIYNNCNLNVMQETELLRLTKSIETTCLRKGLIQTNSVKL